ncbi:LPS export ABC transporter periplasmic protein LptC [bacterium]|nr:LPS export ABC transporter periplasmic protein LptC [bacterium]
MKVRIHRKLDWLVFFLAGIMWVLFYCQGQQEETVVVEQKEGEYPSQEGWQSELILTKVGRRQAVVRYGHMMKFDQDNMYIFDAGVEVDFYDEEGNHTSHLTSERGEYNEETEDIIGMGNVVVESDSGITLRTEVLRWDNRLEKIISDTLVMVTTQDRDTLYGTGFESNADLTRRIIRNPWGTSEKHVDIDELESSFTESASADTVSDGDFLESVDR